MIDDGEVHRELVPQIPEHAELVEGVVLVMIKLVPVMREQSERVRERGASVQVKILMRTVSNS